MKPLTGFGVVANKTGVLLLKWNPYGVSMQRLSE